MSGLTTVIKENLNIKDHSVALQEGQMLYSLLYDKKLAGFFKRTLIFNYTPDNLFSSYQDSSSGQRN